MGAFNSVPWGTVAVKVKDFGHKRWNELISRSLDPKLKLSQPGRFQVLRINFSVNNGIGVRDFFFLSLLCLYVVPWLYPPVTDSEP